MKREQCQKEDSWLGHNFKEDKDGIESDVKTMIYYVKEMEMMKGANEGKGMRQPFKRKLINKVNADMLLCTHISICRQKNVPEFKEIYQYA